MNIKELQCFVPLWVEKGSYIKFRVKGKSRIDPSFPLCSSEGFLSHPKLGINYGALLITIGDSQSFVVKDKSVHLAPVSGPLAFWVHMPKQDLNPSGTLIVKEFLQRCLF